MSVRNILVCLTTEEAARPLMAAACLIAARSGAHVTGIHTMEALMVYPGIAMHVPGTAFQEFNASQEAQAKAIEAIFDAATHAQDFVAEWRLLKAESATAADRQIESARAADLVIMAQEDPAHDRVDQHGIQERMIRESGRPVLILPHGYTPKALGESLLIGWSATREAARAAHDALTLAPEGAAARILTVTHRGAPDRATAATAADLANALARHGLKTEVTDRPADGAGVAEVLLDAAFEQGADMVVTGAFGHSRVYDFVIGAATRELMAKMTLPVLFSG
jgi:nucleotide-binding universal stress UspA family protein